MVNVSSQEAITVSILFVRFLPEGIQQNKYLVEYRTGGTKIIIAPPSIDKMFS